MTQRKVGKNENKTGRKQSMVQNELKREKRNETKEQVIKTSTRIDLTIEQK